VRAPADAAPVDRTGLVLLLGVGAVAAAMVAGRTDAIAVLLAPPQPVGYLLGAAAGVLGVAILLRSADQLGTSREARAMIRAVRLAFLAVAAFAAAAGWILGSPVPIVVALVIAGIDVIETTFLLLVTRRATVADPEQAPDDVPGREVPGRDPSAS
jgi:hypothetical protein